MATLAEVKKQHKANGGKWFNRETMQFFGSKVESKLIADRYFITSETHGSETKRYTIREVLENYDIDTVGAYCAYETLEEALGALVEIASKVSA